MNTIKTSRVTTVTDYAQVGNFEVWRSSSDDGNYRFTVNFAASRLFELTSHDDLLDLIAAINHVLPRPEDEK